MGEYLLGIDIGTSACKIAVFTKDGQVAASGTGDYPVYYPHPGWAEQNPDEWWEAVCRAIPEVLKKGSIDPAEIKGVGIDGQSWSAIAIDREGNVLANTPIWMDTRAVDICEEYNEKIGREKIFELCGNPLQEERRYLNCAEIRFSPHIRLRRSYGIREIFRKCIRRHIRYSSPTVSLHTG